MMIEAHSPPTVIEVKEDCLEVIPVGRFWRVKINDQELTRTRTIETPQGQQVETTPREFITDLCAWGFLGEKQRVYERKYGKGLGWKIKGEM